MEAVRLWKVVAAGFCWFSAVERGLVSLFLHYFIDPEPVPSRVTGKCDATFLAD